MSPTDRARQLAIARIASAAMAAIERVDAGADKDFAIDFIRRAIIADCRAAFNEEYPKRKGDA